MTLAWIVLACLAGGVLSVGAAAFALVLRAKWIPMLVSFAIGTLLGAAFLEVLPHAFAEGEPPRVAAAILGGILGFFLLEKLLLWRHSHDHGEDAGPLHHREHSRAGALIVVGDAIHNFVDGVLIAAAFLTDIHLGIITAIAVAAHEIPQELGDFAILLDSGFTRRKALLYNVLAGLTTVVGAVLAYYSLALAQAAVPYVLAIAASSFIYIAVADLIPGLHKRVEGAATLQQGVLIGFGVAVIYTAHSLLH